MRYVRNMLFKSHGIIQADNLTLKEMLDVYGGKELRRFVAVAALSNMEAFRHQ